MLSTYGQGQLIFQNQTVLFIICSYIPSQPEPDLTLRLNMHRGRNQIYSFHCLLGRPQRPQGCQKMRHYPLNLDLEVWCSNIEPKLNEHQKTSRSHQKRLIFGRISQFLQFWLHIRAPNLQIQV